MRSCNPGDVPAIDTLEPLPRARHSKRAVLVVMATAVSGFAVLVWWLVAAHTQGPEVRPAARISVSLHAVGVTSPKTFFVDVQIRSAAPDSKVIAARSSVDDASLDKVMAGPSDQAPAWVTGDRHHTLYRFVPALSFRSHVAWLMRFEYRVSACAAAKSPLAISLTIQERGAIRTEQFTPAGQQGAGLGCIRGRLIR